MRFVGVITGAGLAMIVTGCSVATSSYHDATSSAGAVVGSLGLGGPSPDAPLPAPAPTLGAFLEGPVGARLGDADKQRAFQAEQDALAAGDRRTWRGVKGNYGFVALSGSMTPEGCQDFTHTVYIMGRPVTGKGTGCKAPDGTWRITG
jgi:surface antigen